ncbi:MAG: serine/threonine-protein kinase [Verrucomicrobiales bacterium]
MSSSSPSSPWEPPPPEELQAMLPQYEILGLLGRGGMGAVYKAKQAKLDRTVAIKVLPETFTRGEDKLNFAKRFEQEARAMANLDHPAILSVYDYGETDGGQLYFVMEFIDGMDIHQYLKTHGGKLPAEHALAICAHVLDALEYAHKNGIVHRDIKPANILLNREGRVKIADFGLAKKFGDHADADSPALTMSNVAVGTPDFVAPEALDSDQVPDHRADLYAVGVMLYQMLTGALPRGLVRMPSELRPELDPRLDDIVARAMESSPDHRYQSAASVRADINLVLKGPMPRVEAGEPSGAVEAVVPVTTSLRGKKAPTKLTKIPLFLGLGAAALIVVGLVVIMGGKRGEPDSLPVTFPRVAVDKPLTQPAPLAPPVKIPEPVTKVGKSACQRLDPTRATCRPAREPAGIADPAQRLPDGTENASHRTGDQIRTQSRLPSQ